MARSRASGPLKIAISELPSWSIFSTRQSPVCTRSRCDDESARSAVQIGSIRPALSQYARCARDSPLQEDGFELSVPGDTVKVLRSVHVVPANVKSAERSSDTGEPCGRRPPASSRPSDERRGPRRPARSSPRSGTADRYAMRVLVGQPFIRLRRRRAAHQRSYRCLLRLWA
jgi:hypothetical protein